MSYLDGYYLNNPHVWQYDGSTWANANCTPTTGANQLIATSGGKIIRTGAQIRSLVLRREESAPADPGWSQYDLALAMKRVYPSQPYAIRNGFGWPELVKDHNAGYYLAVQGDSDQFTSPKCSGAFDGDHCIGVHPATRQDPDTGREQWWTNDPICPTGHWQDRAAIYRYAKKLGDRYGVDLYWGHLSKPVPREPVQREDGEGDVSISTTGLTLTSDHAVTLPKGTAIYQAPENGAKVLGKASGAVGYYGTPAAGWKAVRVDLGYGTLIGYTTTAASAYKV